MCSDFWGGVTICCKGKGNTSVMRTGEEDVVCSNGWTGDNACSDGQRDVLMVVVGDMACSNG